LESIYPDYSVSVTESGTPEAYTTSNLRVSNATWGDYEHTTGWIYNYGEEDWWTNTTGIKRTKDGITYCNTHSLEIAAIGFGWCWDAMRGGPTTGTDPVYGVHWYGQSIGSASADPWYSDGLPWGIDDADNTVTGNSVNMDTYLAATQSYIDYCTTNGYNTKFFFTTGPVDNWEGNISDEARYQGYLKYEHIRDYVASHPTTVLFDYADILCYDDDGTITTTTWSGHTFPVITSANLNGGYIGHIGPVGATRLAKAMWWMLARIAGWDGN